MFSFSSPRWVTKTLLPSASTLAPLLKGRTNFGPSFKILPINAQDQKTAKEHLIELNFQKEADIFLFFNVKLHTDDCCPIEVGGVEGKRVGVEGKRVWVAGV